MSTVTQPSSRHRVFDFQRGTTDDTEATELDPVSFDIGEYTIECVDQVDGLVLLAFTGAMGPTTMALRAQAMTDFLDTCIKPESRDAFRKACAEFNVMIPELGEVCGWLADTYSERPTKPAQPSSAGRPSTGSTSEASSPFVVSTGERSEQPTF